MEQHILATRHARALLVALEWEHRLRPVVRSVDRILWRSRGPNAGLNLLGLKFCPTTGCCGPVLG